MAIPSCCSLLLFSVAYVSLAIIVPKKLAFKSRLAPTCVSFTKEGPKIMGAAKGMSKTVNH